MHRLLVLFGLLVIVALVVGHPAEPATYERAAKAPLRATLGPEPCDVQGEPVDEQAWPADQHEAGTPCPLPP